MRDQMRIYTVNIPNRKNSNTVSHQYLLAGIHSTTKVTQIVPSTLLPQEKWHLHHTQLTDDSRKPAESRKPTELQPS